MTTQDAMQLLLSYTPHPAIFGEVMRKERKTKGYHRRVVNGRSNRGGK